MDRLQGALRFIAILVPDGFTLSSLEQEGGHGI